MLKELKLFCGGSREIQISRELTKKFEDHIGNNIDKAINLIEKMGNNKIIILHCVSIYPPKNKDINLKKIK